jgi:arsenate reductase
MQIILYHNPRCAKSREALQLLRKKNIEPKIIEYLKEKISKEELKKLLMKLHLKPHDIIRVKEEYYKKKLKGLKLNDDEWIDEILENPILIERPIVVKGNKAIIARPPERINDLI